MTDEHATTGGQPPEAAPSRHPQKILPLLCERFPIAFPSPPAPPVPLKRGIRQDLEAALQGVLDVADIRRTIKFWVRSLAYRQVIAAGGQRVDLQGQPVEEVSEAHRAHAAAELKNIQAKVAARQAASEAPKAGKGKAKSKPAEGKQPPAAQPPAQPGAAGTAQAGQSAPGAGASAAVLGDAGDGDGGPAADVEAEEEAFLLTAWPQEA
ncbi:MAG: ProQ/FinO family protein [Pseudomonadota bacterium]|nr:ProQ/FinO family protein [Pseudomonadota bacterium]